MAWLKQECMKATRVRHLRSPSSDMVVLALLIGGAFLFGGGSRSDILSLVVLRPLSALGCAYAIWRTDWTTLLARRQWVLGIAAALVLLPVLHLIPLPPALWTQLPERDVLVMINETIGLRPKWRPWSMDPAATANAAFSLLLPLAVLLLGMRLDRRRMVLLAVTIAALTACSAILGILQLLGGHRGPLYLYRVTNYDSAVGLFANRNHQAVLLAISGPLIALIVASAETAKMARLRLIAGAGALLTLVVFILTTGSRAGLALGLAGSVGAIWIVGGGAAAREAARTLRGTGWVTAAAIGSLVIAVGAIVVALGRAEALDRMLDVNAGDELRLRVWGPVAHLAAIYFPFGTGIGAFVGPYQILEPDALLTPTYLNHAHNDWLEAVMTGGLPAIILLTVAVAMFLIAARRLAGAGGGRIEVVGRTGLVVVAMLALASVADYPLRVPSIMAIFALSVAYVSNALAAQEARTTVPGSGRSGGSV